MNGSAGVAAGNRPASERLARLAAVVRADFMIRLRRPSTAVIFVLLSAMPYLWIPEPTSDKALMQIGGQRAIYNSAAIGMATGLIGTIFIGLFGFYVISNALRRDVITRCGYVIASTTMRGSEYLVGKFAGNVTFLTVFAAGFMATSMAMVVVRGEAPLEPLVFAKQYLILLPPAIACVSALAVLFESTPLLRTKFGDVLYFFLWMGSLGVIGSALDKANAPIWLHWFDISGFGIVAMQLKQYHNTISLSIGSTTWDQSKGTIDFGGLRATAEWIAIRSVATVWPVVLLLVARLFFHRFDPARVRAVPNEKARRSWFGRFNLMAKPLSRLFVAAGHRLSVLAAPLPFLRASITDAVTTIAAFPLVSIGIVVVAIMAAASDDAGALFGGTLPIAWAAAAVAISDVASREKRSGTTALVFAAPSIRTNFVWWKLISASIVAVTFLAVPLGSAILTRPSSAIPLLGGVLFIAAGATSLGVLSANPKTFLVLFLTFWYAVTNDRGQTAAFDFADWYGAATPQVITAYAGASLVLLVVAHLYHLRELARRW